MANYRHQILLDDDTNDMVKAIPAYKRSEYVRNVLKEHKIRQIEKENEKPSPSKAKNVRLVK